MLPALEVSRLHHRDYDILRYYGAPTRRLFREDVLPYGGQDRRAHSPTMPSVAADNIITD